MEAVLKNLNKNHINQLSRLLKCTPPDIRFADFGNGYLVSNDFCDFAYLNEHDFINAVSGDLAVLPFPKRTIEEKVEIYRQLNANNCHATTLHIFVVGLACPLSCTYCQVDAGMTRASSVMNEETATKAVLFALQSPGAFLQIEFQGGEPLSNFSIVKYIIKLFLEKAGEYGKQVSFSLVTSLFGMTIEKLIFLDEHGVSLAVSLDGPEFIHNGNRPAASGNNFKNLNFWVNEIQKTSLSNETGFLLTATRSSLENYEEIINTYIQYGADFIVFRPLAFLGRARQNWDQIGYTPSEFGVAYSRVLNMLINKSIFEGINLIEKQAAMFSRKIFSKGQTNHTEYRSPCGAGIGQIVYDWDGNIYPCDEARMIAVTGNQIFKLGNVATHSYYDCLSSSIIESMCIASCMQSNDPCSTCVFLPLCGLCPVYNYSTYNSLTVDNARKDYLCNIKKEIFNAYFSVLFSNDRKKIHCLREWGYV